MDKDEASAKSSDDKIEVREISFEDIINAEQEELPTKVLDKKEFVDPLMITEEEDERPEKRMKKDVASPVYEKNIIVSPSVNNHVVPNKVVTSSGPTTLLKIAPRSTVSPLTATTTSMTTNGKIIYLQRGGQSVPVRVPASVGTSTAGSNGSKPPVAIQLIRAPHTVIPIKSGKSINIPNVSQLAGKKVITTGDGASGQVVIKGPIKKVASTAVAASSSLTTSVGSTIISPVEGVKIRPVIASKSALSTSTSNGSASSSGKVLMQNTAGTKQVVLPQSLIKISPNSPRGQLQAIQIPGKPGLQYVRVLGNPSGVTQKINAQETNASSNFTVVRQTKPGMKFMVKPAVGGDKERKTMTTVPTLRKINDMVVKPTTTDGADNKIIRTQKITQINSQIQRFSASGESKAPVAGSKYIVVSKSLIHSSVASQSQNASAGQQRQTIAASQKELKVSPKNETGTKKLYSVLRPVTEQKEVKLKARVDPVPAKPPAAPTLSHSSTNNAKWPVSRSSPVVPDEATVTIRRKHCNCTKSQCLKLYCDCFANGEFCQDCNCRDCLNNLDNEDERQKAIRICLERNPNSFKPKITAATNESDLRLHNKGCNCKRSGCLKNYCECYEAKIPCSSNCKCIGCRNVEDHPDLDMDVKKCPSSTIQTYSRVKRTYDDMVKPRAAAIQSTASTSSASAGVPAVVSNAPATGTTLGPNGEKQSCNFITQEVVDATIQCLIAQADECKKSSLTQYQTEKMIMEELGRCLVEIIDFSIRNTGQN